AECAFPATVRAARRAPSRTRESLPTAHAAPRAPSRTRAQRSYQVTPVVRLHFRELRLDHGQQLLTHLRQQTLRITIIAHRRRRASRVHVERLLGSLFVLLGPVSLEQKLQQRVRPVLPLSVHEHAHVIDALLRALRCELNS